MTFESVDRRRVLLNLGGLAITGLLTPAMARMPHPPMWLIRRKRAKVWILAFRQARDKSWFTPAVEAAFFQSRVLWLETPPIGRSTGPPAVASPQRPAAPTRHLQDVLGQKLWSRVMAVSSEFGMDPAALDEKAPFVAYNAINAAFNQRYGRPPQSGSPDSVLAELAQQRGKAIRSEYASTGELFGYLANLPDDVQRERIEDLLEFIEDEKKGLNAPSYRWIYGEMDDRKLQQMRRDRPALYEAMHVERNAGWARRIEGFVSTGGNIFVAIGMNHMVGPDSILNQLQRQGQNSRRI